MQSTLCTVLGSNKHGAIMHNTSKATASKHQANSLLNYIGVQRGLIGKVISRFEDRGYKLVAMKTVAPSKELAERHYADLKNKPFFPSLVEYMSNGAAPVVGRLKLDTVVNFFI